MKFRDKMTALKAVNDSDIKDIAGLRKKIIEMLDNPQRLNILIDRDTQTVIVRASMNSEGAMDQVAIPITKTNGRIAKTPQQKRSA